MYVDVVVPAPADARAPERVWRRLIRRPAGATALVVICLVVLSAVLAPLLAPFGPTEIGVGPIRQGPTADHLFGTDELGRDLLSRTLYAGRLALWITVLGTAIAMVVGSILGAVAALLRGLVDETLMRVVDAALAIPFLLMALILVTAFGFSALSLSVVLGLVNVPMTARIVRAAVLAELHREYVLAARSYGTKATRLLWTDVFPNVVPTLLVQTSVVASSVLLTEAGLSFVGLGIQPPEATWGTLILQGYASINTSPTLLVFPGLMTFVTVWAISALAEQLQAVLDVTTRPGVRSL